MLKVRFCILMLLKCFLDWKCLACEGSKLNSLNSWRKSSGLFFFFWSRSFIDPFSCVFVCLNCSSCWWFFLFFLRDHTFWLKYSFFLFFFSNLFYWIILKQSVRITPGIFSPFYRCREVINYNAKSIYSHTHINTINIGFLIHGFNIILPSGKVFHKV